jgi:hypothetical protein
MKIDAVHGFDNPKAFGKAIHLYIERAIHLRKLGGAGLFALGTAKIFNPTVAGRHLPSMRACGAPVQPQFRCHTQIDPLPAIAALGCAILRATPGSSANIANGRGQIFETL